MQLALSEGVLRFDGNDSSLTALTATTTVSFCQGETVMMKQQGYGQLIYLNFRGWHPYQMSALSLQDKSAAGAAKH